MCAEPYLRTYFRNNSELNSEISYTYLNQADSHKINPTVLVWLKKLNSTCIYKSKQLQKSSSSMAKFPISGPFYKIPEAYKLSLYSIL